LQHEIKTKTKGIARAEKETKKLAEQKRRKDLATRNRNQAKRRTREEKAKGSCNTTQDKKKDESRHNCHYPIVLCQPRQRLRKTRDQRKAKQKLMYRFGNLDLEWEKKSDMDKSIMQWGKKSDKNKSRRQ
jgi:hypothetical protein